MGVGPVVCSTQLQDEHHRMVLRAGAIYTRTQAAKCDEILSAEEVTSIVHRAAAKYASDLTRAIGDLLRRTPSPESEGPAEPESERETPSSVIDRYNDEMLEAERFLVY